MNCEEESLEFDLSCLIYGKNEVKYETRGFFIIIISWNDE